ncbi:alpha/beta hydrolase [Paraburkholderia nemoris]|nr:MULTISPECIES: alpha/beta fold hydrolase [Paraburkholderia]
MDPQSYRSGGIRVEHYPSRIVESRLRKRPPILCIHGGCHASWCWAEHASVLASAGYDVHVPNWMGRGGSDSITDDVLAKLTFFDVVEDMMKVTERFTVPPIIIGHSMGSMVAQLYAMNAAVHALVLLTPVVPSNIGAKPLELPVDFDSPWPPPPLEVAKQLFFQGLNEDECQRAYALLVPESSRRVYDATRWSVSLDPSKIGMPTLVVSGALDLLTPPETGKALAHLYGAEYRLEPDHGHNVLLGSSARRIAADVVKWLEGRV